jgi:hypothetical protein
MGEPPHGDDRDEVILERVRSGGFLKVTAIHVATGIEAAAVGPAAEPKAVERLAMAKLKAALLRSMPPGS